MGKVYTRFHAKTAQKIGTYGNPSSEMRDTCKWLRAWLKVARQGRDRLSPTARARALSSLGVKKKEYYSQSKKSVATAIFKKHKNLHTSMLFEETLKKEFESRALFFAARYIVEWEILNKSLITL